MNFGLEDIMNNTVLVECVEHYEICGCVDDKKETKEMKDENITYEQGLADAWEVLRKLQKMPCADFYKLFPFCEGVGNSITELIRRMTPAEAIAKIKAYEDKQNEIKVGDEIIFRYNNREKKGVVFEIVKSSDGSAYNVFCPFDFIGACRVCEIKRKTGRHFPQVEELLKAMKEGQ